MTEITTDIDAVIKRTEQALEHLRQARALLTVSPVSSPAPLPSNGSAAPQMKKCPGHLHKGKELPVEAFSKDASKPDGRQRICRECMSDARQQRIKKEGKKK